LVDIQSPRRKGDEPEHLPLTVGLVLIIDTAARPSITSSTSTSRANLMNTSGRISDDMDGSTYSVTSFPHKLEPLAQHSIDVTMDRHIAARICRKTRGLTRYCRDLREAKLLVAAIIYCCIITKAVEWRGVEKVDSRREYTYSCQSATTA